MDISIVIVSYNVKEFLRGAIQSALRSLDVGGLTGEILVVDNDSSDASVDMVRSEFPSVRVYTPGVNLGFGRANNLALRDAAGDYLLLLNPDTILGEDTLRCMVDFMRAHPEAGLSGCKLLNGDGSFQLSCRRGFPTPWASFAKLFGLSRLFPKSRIFAQYNLTYLPVDATYEVDALGGAFMLMSRAAYEATKGFDEDYFMYGEDLDLCFRVKEAGFKVYYVHETATIHFKGESTKRSAINEVNVFYEAMHIFVKKNYGGSTLFSFMLRLGIVLRTAVALVEKYRGGLVVALLDWFTVLLGVVLGSRLVLGRWLGLPMKDYPYALILPPFIVLAVLAALRAYQSGERRSMKQIVIAIPLITIGLSSLTYFFKEFPASRQLVLGVSAVTGVLLIAERFLLKVVDRIRWGGHRSASPVLHPTLVVGTGSEAVRIAELLKRTEFLRRYEIAGFIDRDLSRLNEELLPGIRIVGDTRMLAKVVRDRRISEVLFSSDSVPYSEMLAAMQRVSAENPGRAVNFNMVPTASEVLIGRRKIELLAPALAGETEETVALMAVEYNLQRLSHRAAKRLLDVLLSGAALPILALGYLFLPKRAARQNLETWRSIFFGRLTLVGVAGPEARRSYFPKAGVTSLAEVAAPQGARAEDLDQFDRYYARNHTIAMDCEILLKSILLRRSNRSMYAAPGVPTASVAEVETSPAPTTPTRSRPHS